MKLKLLFLHALLMLFTGYSHAEQILEVKKMTTLDISYSVAEIEVELTYDGSIGDGVFFGAVAIVDESVSGEEYKPSFMSNGPQKLFIELTRPKVMHNESFSSHSIDFLLYTRNISKHVIVPFNIQWPSYEQRFSSEDHKIEADEQFSSVETVMVNEALHSSGFLIQSINAYGLTANQMHIIYKSLEDKQAQEVSVRIAEGISLSDIKLLVKIIEREDIKINSISFLAKAERNYKYGHIGILEGHNDDLGANAEAILEAIKESNELKDVYEVSNFTPSQKLLSNEDLLAKAELLVQIGGFVQIVDAEMILNQLMDKQYYNPKLFWVYAKMYLNKSKIYLKRYWLDPKFILLAIFILYLFTSWFYKRFIKLPDIETMSINTDDPIIQDQIKNSKNQIIRFIEGLEEGKLVALIKFPLKIDEVVEHVWGVAHSKKANHIIASLDSEPEEAIDERLKERMSVQINEVEDWMLIDGSGKTFGGYSFLALAQLYEKQYGRLPKRYISQLDKFNDFSWTAKKN